MVFALLLILYVFICIILCFLVLIQSDKGGGISGAIGGGLGNASSLLGTQDTANILTRGTTIFAGAFMALCIILSVVLPRTAQSNNTSLLKKRAETQQNFSPASALQPLPITPAEGAIAPGGTAPIAPLPVAPAPAPAK